MSWAAHDLEPYAIQRHLGRRVAIGVAAPEFLFTWVVAAGYLLLMVVALPFVIRRLRR